MPYRTNPSRALVVSNRSRAKRRDPTSDKSDEISIVYRNENLEPTDEMLIPKCPTQVISDILSFDSINVFSSSTTGPSFNSVQFAPSNFSQFADYAAVFDQFRILSIEAIFRPQNSQVVANTQNPGEITVAIDLDDANVPTTLSQLQQYSNQITKPAYKRIRRCWKPHSAVALYGTGGIFTSFANMKDQWIDCASTGALHYGLKLGWSTTTVVYAYDMTVRAHFQFKQAH
jgi:hypothetical protein